MNRETSVVKFPVALYFLFMFLSCHTYEGASSHQGFLVPVAVTNNSCACFFIREKASDSSWGWCALALIITGICSRPETNRVLKTLCSWAEWDQCKNIVTFYDSFILIMEVILKESTFHRTDNYPTKIATILHLDYKYEALERFAASQFTHCPYSGFEL